ncbi:hypothetical protein V496_03916 [Pseudogymnoascus sp. VKM F-4515 (FW-2607)]|nr:hypothetical protein V496_03916 [Pseudogymnoascus sp. VKM F-4515 (FW-2607)]KFY87561.1 hypothetical protein V498_07119 [Pseudogymnoascus sp. VKM F-4517 (FW-2822)]
MTTASFRIEIIPKPIYVGGSGPPMAPITLLPEHDEESWVIAELINYGNEPQYVVHPKDKPVVRKIVRKIDALDWVSPRVVEAFEMEESRRRDAREEELEQERERHKLTKNGKKRGRPFKYIQPGASASLLESIETETDTADDHAQPSLSQPSLSQPHLTLRHRSDSPLDTENTENTEDEGIPGTMEPPPRKRSRISASSGPSSKTKTPRTLQDPLSSAQTVQTPAPTSTRPPRSSKSTADPETPHQTPPSSPSKSRTPRRRSTASAATSERRGLRDRSAQPFYGHRQRSQSVYQSHSASPAKSAKYTTPARYTTRSSSRSRNATPLGGVVQKPATKGWKSAPPKPNSTSQKRSKASTPSKSKPSRPAAESDDDEGGAEDEEVTDGKQWKVLRLLDDKYRMIKHRRCRFYLTQWAGDYEPTWERSTNITHDLKVEYEAWKATPEGKAAHKSKTPEGKMAPKPEEDVVENGAGGSNPPNPPNPFNPFNPPLDNPVPRAHENDIPSPTRSTSLDDQAQASRQLGGDLRDLPRQTDDDAATNDGADDSPDPLAFSPPHEAAAAAVAVKREREEEGMDELAVEWSL